MVPATDIVNLNGHNHLLNSFSFDSIIYHSLSAENYFSVIKHSFCRPFDSATRGGHTTHPLLLLTGPNTFFFPRVTYP